MAGDDLLHLPGPHLEAAGLDHILLAIDDEQVTVFIQITQVAGEKPALALDLVDSLSGGLGPIEVFQHQLWCGQNDLADFTFGQLLLAHVCIHNADGDIRDRHAHRPHLVLAIHRRTHDGHHGFGQGVAFDDAGIGQGLEAFFGILKQCGCARDIQLDGGQIRLA